MKVLVVDDSAVIRQHVGGALREAGHFVIEAGDGFEAMSIIEQHQDLAVVVLDINMPRMDGVAVLEKLRDRAPSHAPPVLVLTTEGDPALMRQARSLGAKAWMTKPVKTELLVSAINKLALTTSPTIAPDAVSASNGVAFVGSAPAIRR